MVKVVDKGERFCSITLDGSESSITFQEEYLYFSVQNNSDSVVYISLNRDIVPNADGVMAVNAGSSVLFGHMKNVNRFFVKGTGPIQIAAANEPINFFVNASTSSGGESGGDYYTKAQSDAKYVQASNLAKVATSGNYSDLKGTPEKLPANGGNADTADAINGLVILNSENIALRTVDGYKKWVCMANTIPNSVGYVTAGIWFKNNLSYSITAQIIAYAAKKAPTIQAGYGTGTMEDMLEKGRGREWFANTTLETTATPISMVVPPGKTGYFGFNRTTEGQEAYINDVKAYTVKDVRLM